MNTLLKNMGSPLIVSKLEGDAIFAYAPDGSFLQGQTLLEAIENLYCLFASTLEQMHRNTTCTCKACELIPTLDLKFVTHHGTFILSKIGGREELSGPDVILIHRLLKSEITETTGVKAYAFFTQACAEAMRLGELAESMQPHTENYQHIGDVHGYVHDLYAIWDSVREQRRVVVEPQNLWFDKAQVDIPAPPALAWDYLTRPELKQQWVMADNMQVVGLKGGRTGVGTKHHCAHGKQVSVQTIMDWRPFEYITYDTALPLNGYCHWTMSIMPIPNGSRLTVHVGKPAGRGGLGNLIMPLLGLAAKNFVKKSFEQGRDIVRRMVEEDLAAGKIVAVSSHSNLETSQL